MSEYYWTPKRIKELKARGYKLHSSQDSLIKKGNRLTNKENYDKGIDNEKIQSKNIRNGDRRNSDNTIRPRANDRKVRK